jgi:hypothetical protein
LDAQSQKENNTSIGGKVMIQPLPLGIAALATELNISKIILNFSGGSDEGYLEVDNEFKDLGEHTTNFHYWESLDNDQQQKVKDFLEVVETWAWEAIGYNGAGDGSDYGDDLTYDLVEKTVEHNEWYMQRTDDPHTPVTLEFEEPEYDEDGVAFE